MELNLTPNQVSMLKRIVMERIRVIEQTPGHGEPKSLKNIQLALEKGLKKWGRDRIKNVRVPLKVKEAQAMKGHIKLYRARHVESDMFYCQAHEVRNRVGSGKKWFTQYVKTNLRPTQRTYVGKPSQAWLNSYRGLDGKLIEGRASDFVIEELTDKGWVTA